MANIGQFNRTQRRDKLSLFMPPLTRRNWLFIVPQPTALCLGLFLNRVKRLVSYIALIDPRQATPDLLGIGINTIAGTPPSPFEMIDLIIPPL